MIAQSSAVLWSMERKVARGLASALMALPTRVAAHRGLAQRGREARTSPLRVARPADAVVRTALRVRLAGLHRARATRARVVHGLRRGTVRVGGARLATQWPLPAQVSSGLQSLADLHAGMQLPGLAVGAQVHSPGGPRDHRRGRRCVADELAVRVGAAGVLRHGADPASHRHSSGGALHAGGAVVAGAARRGTVGGGARVAAGDVRRGHLPAAVAARGLDAAPVRALQPGGVAADLRVRGGGGAPGWVAPVDAAAGDDDELHPIVTDGEHAERCGETMGICRGMGVSVSNVGANGRPGILPPSSRHTCAARAAMTGLRRSTAFPRTRGPGESDGTR